MTEIIRTTRNGCFQVRSNAWGSFLAPCPDPDAQAELEKGALDRFELHSDIHKIPAGLWQRWIQLCFHFAHLKQGDLEVSCRLLRREDDRSQWRILVPRQEVSGASVRIDSFDSSIDIETGELVKTYPPEGWVPAGSSHSHNSMPLAKFSSTDDASELGCPGLHIVVSHINTAKNTYVATASITANHRRFYLDAPSLVIDLAPVKETFHTAVLDVIQPERTRSSYQGVWLPGHLSRAERDAYGFGYGSSSSSLTRTPGTPPVPPKKSPTQLRQELLLWGDTPEDILKDTLHELFEAIQQVRDTCIEFGLDQNDARQEVLDAINFTFSPDDPIHWLEPADQPSDTASGADSPTPVPVPVGEW